MQISTHLDKIRSAFPACEAIAYVDLGAQMILVKSTGMDVPHERWEELCEAGMALLTGELARLACDAMIRSNDVAQAIVLEADELLLFLKSESNAEDALFCVGDPSLSLDDFIEMATTVLDRIAQDD